MSPSNSQLRTTTGAHPRITLYFDTSDGVFDGSNLCVLKNKTFATTSWFNIGSSNTPNYLNSRPLKGSITSTSDSFNSFGTFTLGSLLNGYNPLPIQKHFFRAIPYSDFVKLEWNAFNNPNLTGFIIEKSTNGLIWNQVAEVDAINSNSSSGFYYFIDSNSYSKKVYYRLSQKYADGLIQIVNYCEYIPTQQTKLILFPNPSSQWCYIKTLNDIEIIKQIEVFDLGGKKMDVLIKELNKREFHMDVSPLKSGLYQLRIETNLGYETKFIKID
jgi:hypothetical protein